MTITADLFTIVRVALTRLRAYGHAHRYGGGLINIAIAENGLAALEGIKEQLSNSVPVRQTEMFRGGKT